MPQARELRKRETPGLRPREFRTVNGSGHHDSALSVRILSELASKMPPHDILWYDFDSGIVMSYA